MGAKSKDPEDTNAKNATSRHSLENSPTRHLRSRYLRGPSTRPHPAKRDLGSLRMTEVKHIENRSSFLASKHHASLARLPYACGMGIPSGHMDRLAAQP